MEEPLSRNLQIALLLSKADISMSIAEAIESSKIYFKIASFENINNCLIINLKEEIKEQIKKEKEIKKEKQTEKEKNNENIIQILKWLKRLALTKEAHLIIGTHKKEKITWSPCFDYQNKEIDFLTKGKKEETTFKISTRNTNSSKGENEKKEETKVQREKEEQKKNLKIEELAKELQKKNFRKTSMHNPDVEFAIIRTVPNENIIGIKLWENKESFEERRAHLRPVLHPTAINPRLARAMINLAGARKEILDPFCGIGGILLEASKINIFAKGGDLEPSMIKRAEINLKGEQNIKLYCKDALTWKEKVECVVTDLPYGKSSKLETPLPELIEQFLTIYKEITDTIVFCAPVNREIKIPQYWEVKYNFKIYIHKSLTRNIFVLQRKVYI